MTTYLTWVANLAGIMLAAAAIVGALALIREKRGPMWLRVTAPVVAVLLAAGALALPDLLRDDRPVEITVQDCR